MSTNDIGLLDAWRERRDADAFTEIIRRHGGLVYSICKRILRNTTDADDVAQEEEMRASYLLWRDFESLGKNAQGFSEYRHRETGIVFVALPGG